MDTKWQQSALFPDEGGVIFAIQLSLSTESSRIGLWVRGTKTPKGHQITEGVSWHNLTENGFAGVMEKLIEFVNDTEEDHGLILDKTLVDRISAPF